MDFRPASVGTVFHNVKAEIFLDGSQKIVVCSSPIFKSEWWELREDSDLKQKISKPKDMGKGESRADNVRRAKKNIFNIAMLNEFKWFITWTLDKDLVDRYDAKEVKRRLQDFLKNKVRRNNARYLIIPEYHKDGAIHMHGFLAGDFEMVDSGHKTKDGRRIYNMPQWRLGYSTAIELDQNKSRASQYITKYVTKDFKKIFGSFYYAGGHGLIRHPPVQLYDVDFDSVSGKEYCIDGLPYRFKYIDVDGCGSDGLESAV